jgi:twitching motility protein PilT
VKVRIDPNIRFADIVHAARIRNASDIHLAACRQAVARVDGTLTPLPEGLFDAEELWSVAAGLMSDSKRAEFDRVGDVSMAIDFGDGGRARMHVLRTGGEAVLAIRLLDREPPTMEQLNLPAVVRSLGQRERGLVVLAGPTGCGKSTTLAAIVGDINRDSPRRIVTFEDPIEYRHDNLSSFISQREIGIDAPTIQQALVGALRADPDVLIVGEVRDAIAMHTVLMAAETGHLVFVTLHTGTASETVQRIVDMFDGAQQAQARSALAESLVAVVCQRLVKGALAGRRAVAEILIATPALKSMIRQSKTHLIPNAIVTGRRHGMQTFAQHAAQLAADGEISLDAARRFEDACSTAA